MKTESAIQLLGQRGWLSFTPAGLPQARAGADTDPRVRERHGHFPARGSAGGPWVIMKGAVRRSRCRCPASAPHFVHWRRPAYWFGEGPLIVGNAGWSRSSAIRQSTLGNAAAGRLSRNPQGRPGAWQWIALLSAMTTDLSMGVAVDSLLRDPSQRTAALLLRLAGVRSNVFQSKLPVTIQLRQASWVSWSTCPATPSCRSCANSWRADSSRSVMARYGSPTSRGLRRAQTTRSSRN